MFGNYSIEQNSGSCDNIKSNSGQRQVFGGRKLGFLLFQGVGVL